MSDNIYLLIEIIDDDGTYQVASYPFADYQAAYTFMEGNYIMWKEKLGAEIGKNPHLKGLYDCDISPLLASITMYELVLSWEIKHLPILGADSIGALLAYQKLELHYREADYQDLLRAKSILCSGTENAVMAIYDQRRLVLYFLTLESDAPSAFETDQWCAAQGEKTFSTPQEAQKYLSTLDESAVLLDWLGEAPI